MVNQLILISIDTLSRIFLTVTLKESDSLYSFCSLLIKKNSSVKNSFQTIPNKM